MTDTNIYGPSAFWIKARLFINRAMDDTREFEERAFWASCSLELLAKTALAHISPLLVVTPSDAGAGMLVAAGARSDDRPGSTILANVLWQRCSTAFPGFNAEEAKKIAANRNEYVHGSGALFGKRTEEVWWAEFWAVTAPLVEHCDCTIEDFVGRVRAIQVENYLQRNREHVANALRTKIAHAQTQLRLFESNGLTPANHEAWKRYRLVSGFTYETTATCPACETSGVLFGEEDISAETIYPDDLNGRNEPVVILEIAPESFDCPKCHLYITDLEMLEAANLHDSFEVERELEDADMEPDFYLDE
ncbi:hypothetical protein [Pseudoclavibacter helvolus]|uniref:hypothetical protein n=1 Tax=Pseudoclavibacter helvolus TaxID=255205 RepID=UPI003C774200